MESPNISTRQECAVREALLAKRQADMSSYENITSANEGTLPGDPDKEIMQNEQLLPFPKASIFILVSKFFDRFAFNGVKTILVMYLTQYLLYSPPDATVLYHAFLTISFMMSIFGAIIADSWLGKYKTVLYMIIAYAVGMVVLNLGSIPVLQLPSREFTIIAMILIALGTGSMKPCIIALGGDQFKLPEQSKQMGQYYSLHYIILKLAFLCAAALTPVLRNDVQCFGTDYCFPLAFGVPGSFVVVSFTIFIIGSQWLIKNVPTENLLVQVSKCIWNGARLSFKNRSNNSKHHWLDHAIPVHGTPLVTDIKILLNIIVVFLPVPMIYALNEQTGSRWTLQAAKLDGDLGFYQIKPDQMQLLMPVLVMFFIGLFDFGLYSVLHRIGINSELRQMVVGAFLTAFGFVAAGAIELYTMPTVPEAESLHMLWMIPQYALLAMGEAMVGATGLRFAYKEAPASMKTVLQSCWLLTVSGGNLIAMIVVSMHIFETEAYISFLFAVLLLADTLWFMWIIKRYKPLNYERQIDVVNDL